MAPRNANCPLCGAPLEYFDDAREVVCVICGKPDSGHCVCEDGHYVCDACHRQKGVDLIMDVCLKSDSKNPIDLAQQIMGDKSIYPNGPEHHSLVGAVLLTAYKNAGGDIDLPAALRELRNRSMKVPGGTCGYWGVCGAAISAGQFYSIISGSTPMTEKPWEECAHLTARIIGRIADIGGPRCCKRTSFAVVFESVAFVEEITGVRMELPENVTCAFMAGNVECKKTACPFFPKKA